MEEAREESSRTDIRRLLKTFGVKADEAIIRHLERNPMTGALKVRVILQDLTDYGNHPPQSPLHFEVDGEIRRS